MKKSKDIISQENKFLRLCGGKYKDKIKKRIPMTTGEFQKFMYLFEMMGFNEYSVTIQNHPYSKMKSGWPEIAFLIAS